MVRTSRLQQRAVISTAAVVVAAFALISACDSSDDDSPGDGGGPSAGTSGASGAGGDANGVAAGGADSSGAEGGTMSDGGAVPAVGGGGAAAGAAGEPGAEGGAAGSAAGDGDCPALDLSSDPFNCGAIGHVCAPSEIAFANNGAGAVALDATNVYWASVDVWQAPLTGGSATSIAALANPGSIAADGSYVYWTANVGIAGDGQILKEPVGGGVTPLLVSGGAKQNAWLALDGVSAYWINPGDGFVMKVPLAGPANPIKLAQNQKYPNAIATDGSNVYWTNLGDTSGDGRVMRVPRAGGAPVTLAGGQRGTQGIAVGGGNVYWFAQQTDGTFALLKVPAAGGLPTSLVSGLGAPTTMAADADSVYWGPNLSRVRACGGPPITLAPGSVSAVAVDANNLVWNEQNAIMRLDKHSCQMGACVCPGSETVCPARTPTNVSLGPICVDTDTNPDNCGACGNRCSGGAVCEDGACQCTDAKSYCFGFCVDKTTDPSNCGTCGTNCAVGQVCTAGICQ